MTGADMRQPPGHDDLDRFVASLFQLLDDTEGEQDALARLARLVIALAAHSPRWTGADGNRGSRQAEAIGRGGGRPARRRLSAGRCDLRGRCAGTAGCARLPAMGGTDRRGAGAAMLFLVAFLAFVLSGAVPHGWMPQAAAGGVQMVLCSGTGAVAMTVNLGDRQAPEPRESPAPAKAQSCAFAAAQPGAVPPPVPSPEPPAARPSTVFLPAADGAAAAAGLAVRLPPAQAPPRTA